MNTFETICKRRSYRGEFLETPVPREHLRQIMEAGLAAPSGANMQTTSLIAVDDPKLLKKMHEIIQLNVTSTAPAMICVLSRPLLTKKGKCFATQDYAAAIENMLLELVELGYQSCWVEGYLNDPDQKGYQVAQLLGVPDEYKLVVVLPLGIAKGTFKEITKLPFEERAWYNGFGANS